MDQIIEKTINLNGSNIAYNDVGEGQVFLFIHGNPTSKYIWRDIIPGIAEIGRAVALDSLGMGNSDKTPNCFSFEEQYSILEQFIVQLNLTDIILVLHDWGGALGLHYASQHQERISGVVAMEILYNPVISLRQSGLIPWLLFRLLKLPILSDRLIIEKNIFIEKLLQLGTLKKLSPDVIEHYRRPFKTFEDRLSIKSWVDEIPYHKHNPLNFQRLKHNETFFTKLERPKLLLHVWPGFAIPPRLVRKMKREVNQLECKKLGKGLHFIQEDYAHEITVTIRNWYISHQKIFHDLSTSVS